MVPRPRLTFSLLSLLLLSAAPTFAQDLLSGGPECVQTCGALLGVEANCATNIDPLTCFCDSTAVLPDQSTTYCGDSCLDATSQQQLVAWRNRKCSAGQPTQPATTSITTTTAPTATTPRPTSRPPANSNPGHSGSGGGNGGGQQQSHQSWWDKHARWIAMIIVLIIGFSIIIAVGIFFKRRYDQKHNHAANTASNTEWAPNTSQFRSSTISEQGYGGKPSMQERSSYERPKSKKSYQK